jgi:phosphorylcholine metabolism protein LicD
MPQKRWLRKTVFPKKPQVPGKNCVLGLTFYQSTFSGIVLQMWSQHNFYFILDTYIDLLCVTFWQENTKSAMQRLKIKTVFSILVSGSRSPNPKFHEWIRYWKKSKVLHPDAHFKSNPKLNEEGNYVRIRSNMEGFLRKFYVSERKIPFHTSLFL